jgi:hypothetical protein
MSKGYVYIMTTAVDGIIKIGRSDNWTRRCQEQLEANGYKNMNGLKTYFVAKVDNQEEIESIMHDIFRESRVSNFEMFAVDKDRAKRVLSKMGEQVYPEIASISKNKISSLSEISQYYADFWNLLTAELNTRPNIDNISSTGSKDHRLYYTERHFNLGNKWNINADILKSTNQINISVNTRSIEVFNIINSYIKNKSKIEQELGFSLVWDDVISGQDPNKIKRISYYIDNDVSKPIDKNTVKNVADTLIKLYNVFLKYS